LSRKVFEIVADVLNTKLEVLSDDTTQADIETWDSLNSLLLVNEIEKDFDVKFTIDEVIKIEKISDIKKILIKKGKNESEI
jgi:acyl carrier protein|tara:strand:- start:3265 stop:3507 length:243 start_codon:yes stop_codon:yes gene_type:complete